MSQRHLAVRRCGTRTRGTRAHSVHAPPRRGSKRGMRAASPRARGAHLRGHVAVLEERVRAVAQQPLDLRGKARKCRAAPCRSPPRRTAIDRISDAAWSTLHAACSIVYVACCLLHVDCCTLTVDCCTLIVACCLLNVACCMRRMRNRRVSCAIDLRAAEHRLVQPKLRRRAVEHLRLVRAPRDQPVCLRSLGRTTQRAARRAWHGAMWRSAVCASRKGNAARKGRALRLQIAPARPQSEWAKQSARNGTLHTDPELCARLRVKRGPSSSARVSGASDSRRPGSGSRR